MKRKIMIWSLGIIVALGILFALGPREEADLTVNFKADSIGSDIDAYLANREAGISDLKPGANKQMVWHDPVSKGITEYWVVYGHGFSATVHGIRPVPDMIT